MPLTKISAPASIKEDEVAAILFTNSFLVFSRPLSKASVSSLFLNLSFGSLRLSQVNRAFMSAYKGLYEASAITVGNHGEPIYPYYDKNILVNYVTSFIEENVGKFVTSYDLTINFYTLDGITECLENDLARSVKICLKTKINYLFSYEKEQMYSIQERSNLWMKN